MLRGTVKFRARIVDTHRGLTIPQTCGFTPGNQNSVEKVEVECPNGSEIIITVHFAAVDSEKAAISIATEIHAAILDRIAITRLIAIENGRAEIALSPVNGQNNVITPPTAADLLLVGEHPRVALSLLCDELNPILERIAPRGELYFSFFRSARLSASAVEEFMHLYNILLMIFNDSQQEVDNFTLDREPHTPLRPDPRPGKGHINETVYRRLRNEFGHPRPHLNLDDTKSEMGQCLDELRILTKVAIEMCS